VAHGDAGTFFVVGTTRSGTSLLGLMLRNHPAIAFPGEFEFAVDFMPSADAYPDLPAYYDWLSMDRHFRHHACTIDPALPYPELVRSFLVQMKRDAGMAEKPLVGVAVHRHFDRLARLFPDARFVHLVRDPRDVARSWLEFGWSGNAWAAARAWAALEREWDRVAATLPAERVLALRFEDLVRDPPSALGAIGRLLGVGYDDAMLRYHESSTYGPIDRDQVAKWRSALSPNEQRWIEGEAGELLVARGYERCGLPPRRAGALAARWLAADDWLRRWRARIRRFGFGTWLSDHVARALRLDGWQRRIELRRQAIINRSLK
jgi:hypothetical protein